MLLQPKQAEGGVARGVQVHGHGQRLTMSIAAFLRTWRPYKIMPRRASAATPTTPPTTPPTMAPTLVELPLLEVEVDAGAAGVVALVGGGDVAPVTVETDTDSTLASML